MFFILRFEINNKGLGIFVFSFYLIGYFFYLLFIFGKRFSRYCCGFFFRGRFMFVGSSFLWLFMLKWILWFNYIWIFSMIVVWINFWVVIEYFLVIMVNGWLDCISFK